MNWETTLIRCSSIGKIMTEPKSVKAKQAKELSETAKTELIKIYADLKYSRYYDKTNKYCAKGNMVEEDSMTTLSLYTRKMFQKNETRLDNDFFTGLPDIWEGDSIQTANLIVDIKSPYELLSFLSNIKDGLDTDYYGQMQGYMSLTGAKQAWVTYILSNTPDSIYEGEKYNVLRSLPDAATEENPEAKQKIAQLYLNHHFDDIEIAEKVLIFPVQRDDEYIEQAQERVKKCRLWLEWFEHTHKTFNLHLFKPQ